MEELFYDPLHNKFPKYTGKLLPASDPVLCAPCFEYRNLFDEDGYYLSAIIYEMYRILENEGGVGLAANQIGIPLKVVVTIINKKYTSYTNPMIVGHEVGGPDNGMEDGAEGCLSLPNEHYMVKRYKHTCFSHIEYDQNGEEKPLYSHVYGLESRCIQHEIDHLNGILISRRGVKLT